MRVSPNPYRHFFRSRTATHVLAWAALLAAQTELRAQNGEETSIWQFAMREVDWEAVERLQDEIRDYRDAGAIGAYELVIRTNGERLDATVAAEIVDPAKLAQARGLPRAAESRTDSAIVARLASPRVWSVRGSSTSRSYSAHSAQGNVLSPEPR